MVIVLGIGVIGFGVVTLGLVGSRLAADLAPAGADEDLPLDPPRED